MWFPTLIILFAVGVAVGEEDGCRKQLYEKCKVENFPKNVPKTMEDLKIEMVGILDIIKCMAEESKTCKIDHIIDMDYFRKMAQFIEANNNEESPLYQAVSQNYECMLPILRNRGGKHCFLSKEVMTVFISKVEELPETIDDCKYSLYEMTCIAHIIGKQCGQEAKDAATEILQNIRGDFAHCNDESTLSKLRPYKQIFEEALAKAVEGENDIA